MNLFNLLCKLIIKKDEIHSISQKYKKDDIFYFILQNHKLNNYWKNINSELFSNYKDLS